MSQTSRKKLIYNVSYPDLIKKTRKNGAIGGKKKTGKMERRKKGEKKRIVKLAGSKRNKQETI